jgi:hypothetical protein
VQCDVQQVLQARFCTQTPGFAFFSSSGGPYCKQCSASSSCTCTGRVGLMGSLQDSLGNSAAMPCCSCHVHKSHLRRVRLAAHRSSRQYFQDTSDAPGAAAATVPLAA